jgi:hypothetical protein
VGKRKKGRGSSEKFPSSSPDPGQGREAGWPWPTVVGGAPGSAAAGNRGKTEGEMTATYPFSHLGWGRPVEMAPRHRAAASNGGWGGGARRLTEERGSAVAVRGEVGSCRPLFIGAKRRFGRPIFRARGAPVWPAMVVREGPGVDFGRRNSRPIRRCWM